MFNSSQERLFLYLDLSEIRKICEKRKCEGKHWTVSAVELTRSVKVTGVNPQTSNDSLCLYFENKRRSDGGDVDSVLCRHDDFIVTFVDAEGRYKQTYGCLLCIQ